MTFEFATATRIIFGAGKAKTLPSIATGRVFLVTGANPARVSHLLSAVTTFAVHGEPTVELVREGARAARGFDCVVAIGGGSAIDAGKAIAAMATQPGDVLDHLEVVGRAQPLSVPPLPFIAVPTTAGTGAEVTRNAVLAVPEQRVKASLRSPLMLPKVAVVDPELTLGLPPTVTASTGLDALTQLIEPYVCSRANPMVDLFCREGLTLAAGSLATAFHEPDNLQARTAMSYAALLGGLALANAGLGVVHGFAAPIGGMFDAPHGAVCAAILPHGMQANIDSLRGRAPQHPALARYSDIARLLTGKPQATAEDGVQWVVALCRSVSIPPLRTYGISQTDIAAIAEKAAAASSMKANPIELTGAELHRILEASL